MLDDREQVLLGKIYMMEAMKQKHKVFTPTTLRASFIESILSPSIASTRISKSIRHFERVDNPLAPVIRSNNRRQKRDPTMFKRPLVEQNQMKLDRSLQFWRHTCPIIAWLISIRSPQLSCADGMTQI